MPTSDDYSLVTNPLSITIGNGSNFPHVAAIPNYTVQFDPEEQTDELIYFQILTAMLNAIWSTTIGAYVTGSVAAKNCTGSTLIKSPF